MHLGLLEIFPAYLDRHVSHVGVLGALHEDKRGISGVLDHHLVCHFARS